MKVKYKNINIAFPEEFINDIDKQSEIENRTRSELIRESVRFYLTKQKWKKIREYGEKKKYELNISDDKDIEDMIDSYRSEK